MEKIGLVLSGGGGKGAYHIGIWKYLKEVGLDRNIKAISGTSVGALNACLFALGDYDLAERIWTKEVQDKILSIKTKDIIDMLGVAMTPAILAFLKFISTTGVFSREGLISIINKYIDLSYISNSDLPVYACATQMPSFDREYFLLNGNDNETILKMLLASSAIPIIFPMENVNNSFYYDGGLRDNSPLTPLYSEGCTDIIVIKLNATEILKDRRDSSATIYEICPQEELGGFIKGTLDFSPSGASRRIAQGYNDAKKIIGPAVDMAKSQAGILSNLNRLKRDEKILKQKIKDKLETREKLKENLNKYMESLSNLEDIKQYQKKIGNDNIE